MSASPLSFSRMRSKTGSRPDGELGEAADDDVLTGGPRQLGAQLLDRLAVVLVAVDVRLLEQVDLDEHADLGIGVDIGLHGALGGLAAAHLEGLVAEADAQQLDGLVDVPAG